MIQNYKLCLNISTTRIFQFSTHIFHLSCSLTHSPSHSVSHFKLCCLYIFGFIFGWQGIRPKEFSYWFVVKNTEHTRKVNFSVCTRYLQRGYKIYIYFCVFLQWQKLHDFTKPNQTTKANLSLMKMKKKIKRKIASQISPVPFYWDNF